VVADARLYLGRPGALAAIRSPRGTIESTRQRRTSVFELGVGGVAVDQMIGGARTYTINYEQLTYADYTTLAAYAEGHEGPGPFVLLDPGQRNMLPANVAAATSVTNSPDGLPCVGGFTLLGVFDDFNRAPVASGWGTAISGQTWSTAGGLAGDALTTGTTAQHVMGSVNVFRNSLIDTGSTNFDITADVSINVGTPTGGAVTHWICGRLTDTSNHYIARVTIGTSGSASIAILSRSGGTLSGVLGTGSYTFSATHQAGSVIRVHFTGTGTSFTASAWMRDSETEPATPQVTATDATLSSGTQIGLLDRLETGNTNVGPVVTWYRVEAPPTYATLTSSSTFTDAGPRTLAVNFSAAPTASVALSVGIDWPSSTFGYGVPVVAGRPICFSCYVRGGGTDATSNWLPKIVWKDAGGAVISSTTSGSGTIVSGSGSWLQMYATGTPPATAVYADMQVTYQTGASAGSIAYLRRFMLNEGSIPDTTWAAGTGVWPVTVVTLPDVWPFQSPELRAGAVAVFVEDVS